MKGKQASLYCAVALSLSAGLIGCKDDSAAVAALQELTGELSGQAAELNQELTAVAETLQGCMKDLATTKGEAVVTSSSDAAVETPSLEGEASVASLEALKSALNETIEKQKASLSDLKGKVEQCGEDLEAAKAEAEAEAEAKAAAAEAAKKNAAAKKKKPQKSTMAKEREAEGRPTTGTGSRYQKR